MAKLGRPVGTKETSTGCKSRTFNCWVSMRQRCYNPNAKNFKWYGGRGITVCERWRESYANFLEDMGECPAGLWLDRTDNNGNYEPSNCAWITPALSALNRRKGGKIMPGSLRQRALAAGLPYHVVYMRLKRLGWSEAETFETPLVWPGSHWHGGKVGAGLRESS